VRWSREEQVAARKAGSAAKSEATTGRATIVLERHFWVTSRRQPWQLSRVRVERVCISLKISPATGGMPSAQSSSYEDQNVLSVEGTFRV